MNEIGNTVVHAPSDHGLQIISPATTTISSSTTFLGIDEVDTLADLNDEAENVNN
jgi:hypothetical protein